ncbi:hypothetical protein C4577_04405 [Candidatus Parcubacteria bacterium]|nr:MAG: hypothetical protein C4577_04405 [Candidatus Parcubacteria bacterium]
MEKVIKIGKAKFKVYDFVVFALLLFVALFIAILSAAAQLNINFNVIVAVVFGVEAAYILGVINKRNKK